MDSEFNRRVVEFSGVHGALLGIMVGTVAAIGIITLPLIMGAIRDAACLQVCDGVGTYVPAEKRCSCRVAP